METIAKFIKAFFFNEEGEADQTLIGKFKKALLWMLIGAGALFALLLCIPE